jgi:hypothetical protein
MPKINLDVPDVTELASLYRQALEKQDRNLVGVIEAATLEMATVEAASAEAAVLREFAQKALGN